MQVRSNRSNGYSNWYYLIVMLTLSLGIILHTHPGKAQPDGQLFLKSYEISSRDSLRIWIARAADIENKYDDSAFEIYNYTLRKSILWGYDSGKVSSLRGLGNVYAFREQFHLAEQYYIRAIKEAERSPALGIYLPLLYNNYGIANDVQGDYQEAISGFSKSLNSKARFPNTTLSKASIYFNLSATFTNLHQYPKALQYLDSAEKINIRYPDYDLACGILNNRGAIFGILKQYDDSRKNFNKAYELATKHKLYPYSSLLNIGILYLRGNEIDTAYILLKRIVEQRSEVKKSDFIKCSNALAEIYIKKRSFSKAEQMLKNTLTIAYDNKYSDLVQETYHMLSWLKKETGYYKEAINYFDIYDSLKDLTLNKEIAEQSSRLEISYQTAQKDKAIASQQLTILRQQSNLKKYLVLILTCLLFMSGLMFLAYNYRKRSRSRKIALQEFIKDQDRINVIKQQESELKLLKAGIEGQEMERARLARELHDGIGGMLAAVKMNLSLESAEGKDGKFKKVMELIELTADEIRKTSHNLMPDALIRTGLENALESYCNGLSNDGKLDIMLDFQGGPFDLNNASELMVYRVVQELVQNTIKHANASELDILIKLLQDKFSIIVEDNGVGFDVQELNSGLGMKNLEFRVNAMNGNLNIQSRVGIGTTIHIDFEISKLRAL